MKIFCNKLYHELSFSSEGLLFLNYSSADVKEVENCIKMVAGRTNKKDGLFEWSHFIKKTLLCT